MEYDRRIKLQTLQESTSYRNDYCKYPIGARRESAKMINAPEKRPKLLPPCEVYTAVDHESFKPYKAGVHVPFDLLWEPKPITQRNPRIIRPTFDKSRYQHDKNLEASQIKPPLFMSPSIPLDNVEKSPLKDLIIKDMYTTTLRMAQDEVAKYTRPIKRDILKSSLDRQDPLNARVDKFPPLPRAFRHLGKEWDNAQRRGCIDPTKQFWLTKPPHENMYTKIENQVPQQVKDQISELIDRESLRNPHDLMKPLYAGYKPRLAAGVTLEKVNFPASHPEITVQQIIGKRYIGL